MIYEKSDDGYVKISDKLGNTIIFQDKSDTLVMDWLVSYKTFFDPYNRSKEVGEGYTLPPDFFHLYDEIYNEAVDPDCKYTGGDLYIKVTKEGHPDKYINIYCYHEVPGTPLEVLVTQNNNTRLFNI